MLITRSDTVIAVHRFEIPQTKDGRYRPAMRRAEIGGWQLIDLRRMDHFVYSATLLLADIHPTHQVS